VANIRIDLTEPLLDGMDIKFKAPCDCTAVTGMVVYYPTENDAEQSKSFVFKDAHGNNLAGLGNLFSQNAYVKVIVDTTNGFAYIQNADTNAYLEEQLGSKLESATGAASTILNSNLTASRVLVSNTSGKVAVSAVTSTELGYLDGVTSNIQTQFTNVQTSLSGKAASSHNHSASNITSGTLAITRGGTGATNGATALKNLFAAGNTVLSSYQYGTSLPTAGTAGRIFFKKVSS